MKNDEFKRRTDDFLTKPLTWNDVYISWDGMGDITWDDLDLPLEEFIRQRYPGKFEPALKLLRSWFLAHAEHLPAVFGDSEQYHNLVIQIALLLWCN